MKKKRQLLNTIYFTYIYNNQTQIEKIENHLRENNSYNNKREFLFTKQKRPKIVEPNLKSK